MRLQPGKEEKYKEYLGNNTRDAYSNAIVEFHTRWAELMEEKIPEDATDEQAQSILTEDKFARTMLTKADKEGITGFMYDCAVQGLSTFWKHGEALRRWHNIDVGNEKANEKENAVTSTSVFEINT